ncbi:hypothetical protein ACLIIZ_07890 [Azonexus caeni]|uniref:hypothetical protein n=1 Tax=Azonexus caeni TaxID=266126 RepID=UPI003A8A0165
MRRKAVRVEAGIEKDVFAGSDHFGKYFNQRLTKIVFCPLEQLFTFGLTVSFHCGVGMREIMCRERISRGPTVIHEQKCPGHY